jgi:membrane fusion protein (multidrug efflux system)
MIKPRYAIGALCVVAASLAVVWYAGSHAASKAEHEDGEDAANTGNALVVTQMVKQQDMPLTAAAYGDVDAGVPESLSFAQAGRLARLKVLPGQSVHRGDVIATLDSDPAATATYAQAANAQAFAQRELGRNQDLLALQLATQSQVDAAAHQLRDAQAALAAQVKLGGAQASMQLTAPFDAVVVSIAVAQGERLAAGAAIVQLGRRDTPRVLLQIEPALSGQLHAGMPVTLTPLQGDATPLAATVTQVQNAIDPKTQMVGAVVPLNAAKAERLLPGMRVSAMIELGRRRAWSVPRQAVLSDEQGSYLFQVAQGKAHRVNVRTLVETSGVYGVDGALAAAQPVVVQGNYELTDGMAVREAGK